MTRTAPSAPRRTAGPARPLHLLPLAVVLVLLLAACGGGGGGGGGDAEVEVGEAFSFTPAVDTTAAYFEITNLGEVDDVLLAADADGFGSVELHTTLVEGGTASMVELEDGIPVPAGETVVLEPGGMHVMLIGATGPIEPGDEIEIRLTFAEAGEVTLTSTVRDRTADDPAPMDMDMGGEHGDGDGGHAEDGHTDG